MVNLVTSVVACVSVWHEATPPNAAAAGFSPRRRRFWYKTAACITVQLTFSLYLELFFRFLLVEI